MHLLIYIYTVMFFFGIYFLLLFIRLYQTHHAELNDYPEPKEFPSVSFIVPAYNEEKSIGETINCLLKIEYPAGKKEIIVVDDESKDSTARIVEEFAKHHSCISLLKKKNSGKANSVNHGIKFAKGKLIAIVDADSYPEKDSLHKMVGYFEDREVAAVTSRVLVKNTKNFIEKFQAFDYVVIAWGRKVLDFIGCVYVTNGPLSVYRKDLVVNAGGFDPKNLTEDIEITWNLLSKGYKTKMSYSTTVYTVVPDNFKQWSRQRIRWNVGGLQTIAKYYKYFLRGNNLFGYFVLNYVTLSFLLSLVGILLLFRYIFMKSYFYISTIPLIFKGYNPFQFAWFNFMITFLLLFGTIFFVLSMIYYKLSLRGSNIKNRGILSILTYVFIYRPLYIIPYLGALYKIIKGDIKWYTK